MSDGYDKIAVPTTDILYELLLELQEAASVFPKTCGLEAAKKTLDADKVSVEKQELTQSIIPEVLE